MILLENLGLAEVPLQYSREVGPTTEGLTLELLAEVGINCQLFAHWVLEELCLLSLPKDYLSSHIWADTHFVRPVDLACERLRVGDILFSYREAAAFSEVLHLAVMVSRNKQGHAEFLHCLKLKDKKLPSIVCWTLSQFVASKFHSNIFGVRRVISQPQLNKHTVNFDASRELVLAISTKRILECN